MGGTTLSCPAGSVPQPSSSANGPALQEPEAAERQLASLQMNKRRNSNCRSGVLWWEPSHTWTKESSSAKELAWEWPSVGHNHWIWAEEGMVGTRQGPQPSLNVHHSLYVMGSTEGSQTRWVELKFQCFKHVPLAAQGQERCCNGNGC